MWARVCRSEISKLQGCKIRLGRIPNDPIDRGSAMRVFLLLGCTSTLHDAPVLRTEMQGHPAQQGCRARPAIMGERATLLKRAAFLSAASLEWSGRPPGPFLSQWTTRAEGLRKGGRELGLGLSKSPNLQRAASCRTYLYLRMTTHKPSPRAFLGWSGT